MAAPAALCNRADDIGQAIIFSSCGFFLPSSFFLLFFLASSQRSQIGCLPYFYTWCGPSANLECRSEMCCTWLGGYAGCKTSPKTHRLGIIAQLCRAISSQLKHVLTIGKKLVKQQYILHMSPQYGELLRTKGWDLLASFGHPSKFQRVSRLGFGTAATSLNGDEPNFARCLAISCAGTLYIHFPGLLPCNGILPRAKFTLHPSLAFSYIARVTARHSSSGRQRKFAASYKEWNYGSFEDGDVYLRLGGHHVGHPPTF